MRKKKEYNNKWIIIHDNKGVEYIPSTDAIGFVYCITNVLDNKKYIGKKSLNSGTDWRYYYGSNNDLKQDLKKYDKNIFFREVLRECKSKRELTYFEVYNQFKYDVLNPKTNTYNQNILGKFYKSHNFYS